MQDEKDQAPACNSVKYIRRMPAYTKASEERTYSKEGNGRGRRNFEKLFSIGLHKGYITNWVWGHTPVIPELLEAKAGGYFLRPVSHVWWHLPVDHLRSEVRDQPGQHGETPSLLKIFKNYPGVVVGACNTSYLGHRNREIPDGEATRVAGETLLASAAVLPAPSAALPGAEYTGRTGSAGPTPTRKTAIGSAEDGEFHSGRSEPGKRGTGVRQRKTKKQKNFITGRREIQNGRIAAARDCGSR
ncbi:hypothetical protein AAY473_015194 [Plecturocebus cupreus]